MKTRQFQILMLLTSLTMLSCATSAKLTSSTSKTMDIYGPGVVQQPVVAELEVKSEKVSAATEASATSNFESMKNEAVNQAMKKSGADILVEPKFERETQKGRTTVTVTGYPAYYRNFRPMQPGDEFLLNSGVLQKAKVYEPNVITQKSSGKALGWTVGILVATLVVAAAVAKN